MGFFSRILASYLSAFLKVPAIALVSYAEAAMEQPLRDPEQLVALLKRM